MTTDRRLGTDLNRLVEPKTQPGQPLPTPAVRGALSGVVARAAAPASGGALTSIVPPLTEVAAERKTQTVRVYDPSDASVYIDVEQITRLVMLDAKGQQVEFIFSPPA